MLDKAQIIQDFLDEVEQQGIESLNLTSMAFPEKGFYVRPAILKDVPTDAKIIKEEVFGPVLATAKYHNLKDAILHIYGHRIYLWHIRFRQHLKRALCL